MVDKVIELSVEHILLFVVAAFLLYYLIGNCGCRNGFRVGISEKNDVLKNRKQAKLQEKQKEASNVIDTKKNSNWMKKKKSVKN
jgi:hypothetical protein